MKIAIAGDSAGEGLASVLVEHLSRLKKFRTQKKGQTIFTPIWQTG